MLYASSLSCFLSSNFLRWWKTEWHSTEFCLQPKQRVPFPGCQDGSHHSINKTPSISDKYSTMNTKFMNQRICTDFSIDKAILGFDGSPKKDCSFICAYFPVPTSIECTEIFFSSINLAFETRFPTSMRFILVHLIDRTTILDKIKVRNVPSNSPMIHQSSTKCGSMLRFAAGGGNKAMT
jgi:hypothetical protein